MEEAEIPTMLRRALDDSHMPVVAAAAEAIAATVCPTEAEMAVLSFAQACPASGGFALAYWICMFKVGSVPHPPLASQAILTNPDHSWIVLPCNQQQGLCQQRRGDKASYAAAAKPCPGKQKAPACHPDLLQVHHAYPIDSWSGRMQLAPGCPTPCSRRHQGPRPPQIPLMRAAQTAPLPLQIPWWDCCACR